jgi:hypothetical protein
VICGNHTCRSAVHGPGTLCDISQGGGGANVAANKTTDHAIKAVVCTAGSRWQMVDGG